jgi:hypothetical protein
MLRNSGVPDWPGVPKKLVEDGQGGELEIVDIWKLVDRIVEYLDAQAITPEQFRGFSYPATRHAIESALAAVTGGEAPE